jgi:alpha-beta hydrolase superfamily lysophospholipase
MNHAVRTALLSGTASLALATMPVSPSSGADSSGVSAAWSAKPSVSVSRTELSFNNGPVRLSGTLYTPNVAGKVPAVVAFHPAATATRDLPVFEHLVTMLPPMGIAVFVYDRRGSGKSQGPMADGDYTILADDGISALRMLAQDSRVDAKKIGFWGLSQGGWLSLLAASRCTEAAFAISISAPMTPPDVQMIFAVANILRIKRYSQEDIDVAVRARKAVDDFERGNLDRKTAQERLDAAIAKPWFNLIYMDKTFEDPDQSSWAKEIRHDPLQTLNKVKVPTLVLYGAKDPWVPAKDSIEAITREAARHPNIVTHVVAGADHDMMLSVSPEGQIDPAGLANMAPESPEYFGILAGWLVEKSIARVQ